MSDRNICFQKNCPIVQVTADGVPVGRCWHYCQDGKTCPVHGDVTEAFRTYRETGRLTREPPAIPCGRGITSDAHLS